MIIVASSCGMRKTAGELNEVIHVAPIKRLSSLAPGWSHPWDGWLHVLPLPGLTLGDAGENAGANLGRIGLCGSDTLNLGRRLACVSLSGMRALKARLSTYFARVSIPDGILEVGAHEEWHELDLGSAGRRAPEAKPASRIGSMSRTRTTRTGGAATRSTTTSSGSATSWMNT